MINILFIFFLVYTGRTYQNALDYATVYDLASMSRNMYLDIGDKKWLNTTLNNVRNLSNGNDTVRVYLFSNENYTKNVIAIKGTSVYFGSLAEEKIIDIPFERIPCIFNENPFETMSSVSNETLFETMSSVSNDNPFETMSSVSNDKWNDNLFFSCCFEKVGIKECMCESSEVCCKSCYKKSLGFEKNYLNILDKIMDSLKSQIDINRVELMFTGHSLGGMLASYLGIKYNKLTIAFESPGDKHYFTLTDLINPMESYNNIYHFGHNADPIFMGDCGSTCNLLGYHIDTKCHIGNTCLYNAKELLNYTESILNHRVDFIVNNIIPHWKENLPECKIDNECLDCVNKLLN